MLFKYWTTQKHSRVRIINQETQRRAQIAYKQNITTIGIIGYTNNKIKGIDTTINSLNILGTGYRLQVVGWGDHSWLDNLANELNVVDQVDFLGVINGTGEIYNWLDSIDIYI